mmetsp:Transcript_36989/g.118578  ORF Transcript_36989/g.118578 Transcript_36989/m.118578 type:complete len:683 (+) Transcript_36989:325-2373(+)
MAVGVARRRVRLGAADEADALRPRQRGSSSQGDPRRDGAVRVVSSLRRVAPRPGGCGGRRPSRPRVRAASRQGAQAFRAPRAALGSPLRRLEGPTERTALPKVARRPQARHRQGGLAVVRENGLALRRRPRSWTEGRPRRLRGRLSRLGRQTSRRVLRAATTGDENEQKTSSERAGAGAGAGPTTTTTTTTTRTTKRAAAPRKERGDLFIILLFLGDFLLFGVFGFCCGCPLKRRKVASKEAARGARGVHGVADVDLQPAARGEGRRGQVGPVDVRGVRRGRRGPPLRVGPVPSTDERPAPGDRRRRDARAGLRSRFGRGHLTAPRRRRLAAAPRREARPPDRRRLPRPPRLVHHAPPRSRVRQGRGPNRLVTDPPPRLPLLRPLVARRLRLPEARRLLRLRRHRRRRRARRRRRRRQRPRLRLQRRRIRRRRRRTKLTPRPRGRVLRGALSVGGVVLLLRLGGRRRRLRRPLRRWCHWRRRGPVPRRHRGVVVDAVIAGDAVPRVPRPPLAQLVPRSRRLRLRSSPEPSLGPLRRRRRKTTVLRLRRQPIPDANDRTGHDQDHDGHRPPQRSRWSRRWSRPGRRLHLDRGRPHGHVLSLPSLPPRPAPRLARRRLPLRAPVPPLLPTLPRRLRHRPPGLHRTLKQARHKTHHLQAASPFTPHYTTTSSTNIQTYIPPTSLT